MKSFIEYIQLREADEPQKKTEGMKSEIKLKDAGYEDFIVNKSGPRKNLSILVDAFLKSGEIEYGPKVVDKTAAKTPGQQSGGLTRNKLGKKTLYLVGGAVRDHLLGQEANDYDLATDSTMDEIRIILRAAGFAEVAPQTKTDDDNLPDDSSYKHLPKNTGNKKQFYVQGTDLNGEEFVMGAKINGEEFEIATFRKDTKGTSDGRSTQMEFTPHIEEDAERRDFTINSMYIPLTNSNGPNGKLLDFHGGALDLKKKKVKFVGKPEDRLGEDQLRALRYARFAGMMGDTPDEEIIKAVKKISNLPALQPHKDAKGNDRDRRQRIYDEFSKTMQKVGKGKIDVKGLMKLYNKLGLFDALFPGLKMGDMESEDTFHDEKDKHMQVAWMLKNNDPDEVHDKLMDGKWTKSEVKRIKYLLKMLKFHPEVDPDELDQYASGFNRSGFSSGYLGGKKSGPSSHLATWADMNGLDSKAMDAFLQHMSMGDIKASPDHPDFANLYTLNMSGKLQGGPQIGVKKRELGHKRFLQALKDRQPKNV